MATVREYAYFIKGSKIALVEKDTQFDNDPNSKDYGPGSDRAQWKSPLADASQGLELEYAATPGDHLLDEKDEIPVPPYLERALIDYVKAQFAEEVGNLEMKEYFMKGFRKKVEKHESSKIRGYRATIAGPHSIR